MADRQKYLQQTTDQLKATQILLSWELFEKRNYISQLNKTATDFEMQLPLAQLDAELNFFDIDKLELKQQLQEDKISMAQARLALLRHC